MKSPHAKDHDSLSEAASSNLSASESSASTTAKQFLIKAQSLVTSATLPNESTSTTLDDENLQESIDQLLLSIKQTEKKFCSPITT